MSLKSNREKRNQELFAIIKKLQTDNLLGDAEINYLEFRWFKSFLWMDKAAVAHKTMHYAMRLVMSIGTILIPVLTANDLDFRFLTLSIGLIVAISTAIEELFKYKDYWYHHRIDAELLRSEGWQFFQKIGHYKEYSSHREAFPIFATRIEEISQSSVDSFICKIIQSKDDK
jgi:Protein of unknown function (DUF4231)